MTTNTLVIKQLGRTTKSKGSDELTFSSGVNVIVGPPNTGKTKWLRTLDFVFGDPDPAAATLGDDISEKYDTAYVLVAIGNEEYRLERRWKEPGLKSKVLVNEDALSADDFSDWLLTKLEIPIVNFPQGNPYSERKWPRLTWRIMLRHIYRQQRFWSDLADMQPEGEQHAALMQFLGIAEHLFSEQYGDLISRRRKVIELQGAKEQFLRMLEKVSKELLDEQELQVALTPLSLDSAIARMQAEAEELQRQREVAIDQLVTTVHNSGSGVNQAASQFDSLSEAWSRVQSIKDQIVASIAKASERLSDLQKYLSTIEGELARLSRTVVAGTVLADLKVTHCPVCDQRVDPNRAEPGYCFLCGQSIPDTTHNELSGEQRLEFEIAQLTTERQEISELIASIEVDRDAQQLKLRSVNEEATLIDNQLAPTRQVAAAILPPEIAIYDMHRGRVQERIRQLERVKATLATREELTQEIDQLQAELKQLEAEVLLQQKNLDFEASADAMADGMNTYLNRLEGKWTQLPVDVKLRERSFQFSVDKVKWSTKLGGTLTLYFLLAYHFALLNLTGRANFHYPGLAILDFPATLEDGSTVADKENFIIQPFVWLSQQRQSQSLQVIAAGSRFENLHGAHRIELYQVWR